MRGRMSDTMIESPAVLIVKVDKAEGSGQCQTMHIVGHGKYGL